MTLRKLTWALVCVLAILSVCGIIWSLFGTYDVVLSQQELQAKIDAKLPYQKSNVTVPRAVLELEDGRIVVSVDATTHRFGTDFAVTGHTRGELQYDSERGAFFYRPDSIVLKGVSVSGHVLGPKALAAAQNGTDMIVLKAVQEVLEHVPVYKLPDTMKGNVTRLVLDKVDVQNGTVVAHLSFWRLTTACFIWAGVLVMALCMAVGMLAYPELFAAMLLFSF